MRLLDVKLIQIAGKINNQYISSFMNIKTAITFLGASTAFLHAVTEFMKEFRLSKAAFDKTVEKLSTPKK